MVRLLGMMLMRKQVSHWETVLRWLWLVLDTRHLAQAGHMRQPTTTILRVNWENLPTDGRTDQNTDKQFASGWNYKLNSHLILTN